MNDGASSIGTPTSWMDTVPGVDTSSETEARKEVEAKATANRRATQADSPAQPQPQPQPQPRRSSKRASSASESAGGHKKRKRSRKSRSKPVALWHRPLGMVIGDVVRTIANKLQGPERSTALTVIGGPYDVERTRGGVKTWPLVLSQAVKSAAARLLPAAPRRETPARPGVTPVKPSTKPSTSAKKAVGKPAQVNSQARRPTPPPPMREPLTRPINDPIGGFLQQLYADASKTLLYNPAGMGELWVQSAAGHKHTAGPEAKWHFLTVIKRFEELGETMNKFNPRYVAMTKSFAEALVEHPASAPFWQDITKDDPRSVARCFAGLEKPQNVIDIPASAIHKIVSTPGDIVSV